MKPKGTISKLYERISGRTTGNTDWKDWWTSLKFKFDRGMELVDLPDRATNIAVKVGIINLAFLIPMGIGLNPKYIIILVPVATISVVLLGTGDQHNWFGLGHLVQRDRQYKTIVNPYWQNHEDNMRTMKADLIQIKHALGIEDTKEEKDNG